MGIAIKLPDLQRERKIVQLLSIRDGSPFYLNGAPDDPTLGAKGGWRGISCDQSIWNFWSKDWVVGYLSESTDRPIRT